MNKNNRSAYINICIGYRVLALMLSSSVYIAISRYYNSSQMQGGILVGMVFSCLISSWLYQRIGENITLLRVMFILETFAYGFFTWISGGLYSPYLWYQLSCILLMIALEKNILITIFASLICMICALSNTLGDGLSYQELHIATGMVIVIGAFYILRFYIGFIERQSESLVELNHNLQKEKARSEYAYLQLANLYETFHLFAMTNPEKIIRELTLLLGRAIAPSGCILIKMDGSGHTDRIENNGMDNDLADRILSEINKSQALGRTEEYSNQIAVDSLSSQYDIRRIGEDICPRAIFIRKKSDEGQEHEAFYWNLIRIIFSNLDIHNQLEHFIAMEEQSRIANEIHDTVIQKLFGVVCSLKILQMNLAELSESDMHKQLEQLKKSVELTMSELRESIYGRSFDSPLRTFVGALSLYMEEARNLSGTEIAMDIDSDADYLSSAQKIAMYRIACEAVNNAIRHGKANRIDIVLSLEKEQIHLQIADNGIGLKNTGIPHEGNGLKNMRNIVALLKGSLLIESNLGKGTCIQLHLPR